MPLIRPLRNPLDYSLCNQTVTVYHCDGKTVTTTVHKNVFFEYKKTESVDKVGTSEKNAFLLVIPGKEQAVHVGDKILHGAGKAITTIEEWSKLVPANAEGLVVVKNAAPMYWRDRIVHTEAGG